MNPTDLCECGCERRRHGVLQSRDGAGLCYDCGGEVCLMFRPSYLRPDPPPDTVTVRRADLEALRRAYEMEDGFGCPVCTWLDGIGHAVDCWLGNALKETKP